MRPGKVKVLPALVKLLPPPAAAEVPQAEESQRIEENSKRKIKEKRINNNAVVKNLPPYSLSHFMYFSLSLSLSLSGQTGQN